MGEVIGSGGLDGAASDAYFSRIFDGRAVMAIVRGLGPSETAGLCERAWEGGIETAEVPIETQAAERSLHAAVEAGRRRGRTVGAGTVTTLQRVREAVSAGASFTVAPGLDELIAQASLNAGLPHLPGVATPTEIERAMAMGFNWMKLFPARELGAGWVRALLGPFPQLCLVATGGMSVANAAEFLSAGARVVAVGGALSDPAEVAALGRLGSRAVTLSESGQPGNK